jgi:hypothetical protein
VHACNPRTQEGMQEDDEFQASLVYSFRPCVKKNKTKQQNSPWADGVAQVVECLPSKCEAEFKPPK